jgi:large subunit ribosomal protein L21
MVVMEAYAVVETGGKQYLVKAKDKLDVELLKAKEGEKIELTRVLAVSDGKTLTIGKPVVDGTKVTATVLKQFRAEKVYSFKKKRRKGFKRLKGHRQNLMALQIESIG